MPGDVSGASVQPQLRVPQLACGGPQCPQWPGLMSPHALPRPLSEYRAITNNTAVMENVETRAIVVHMFLFPPSPLLFDGFICNFSPPSAGPVLVPAWAYPDGWFNNVHYCVQVMLDIYHTPKHGK